MFYEIDGVRYYIDKKNIKIKYPKGLVNHLFLIFTLI